MAGDETGLTGLWFEGQTHCAGTPAADYEEGELPVFAETVRWLDLYFQGKDPGFLPALNIHTPPFRKEVLKLLSAIPYGETRTYGELAESLAAQRGIARMSAQAVGGAVARNPVSLIIPCHRVIGSDGSLTGYAGGLWRKEKLLNLEKKGSLSGMITEKESR